MTTIRFKDQTHARICNFEAVSDWFASGGNRELAFYKSSLLHRDNRDTLPILFGPPQDSFVRGHRFTAWRFEQDGLVFWVWTAKDKGSDIEVECPEGAAPWDAGGWPAWTAEVMVEFVDSLFRRLHAVKPGWMPPRWTPAAEDVALRPLDA